MRFGLAVASRRVQSLGEMEMRVRVIRVQVERDPERRDRGIELFTLGVQAADLRPGFEILPIRFNNSVVAFERRSGVAGAIKGVGKTELALGVAGTQHERHPECLDGTRRVAVL